MKKWLLSLATLAACGAINVASAQAQIGGYQPPQVNPRPNLSPYLNLIPNNPASTYYGIVRPQFQTGASLQQLQQEIYTQGAFQQLGGGGLGGQQDQAIITGHQVTFQNYSHYFPTRGNRFAGMGASGGSAVRPTSVFNSQGPVGYRR